MNPDELEDLIDELMKALRGAEHDRAVKLSDRLMYEAPDNPVVRALRVQALLVSESGREALAEARHTVALDPQNAKAHGALALAAWRNARLALAQESFERAIELSDRSPRTLLDYAWFMAYERGPRPAEAAVNEAVEAVPNASTAWAALALIQLHARRFHKARDTAEKALKIDPADPCAQSAMVEILRSMRQDHQAVALAHVLEETPGTEPIVAEAQREAKRRKLAGKMVELNAMPSDRDSGLTHRHGLWLVMASVMTAGVVLIFQPKTPFEFIVSIGIPLLFIGILRRLIR